MAYRSIAEIFDAFNHLKVLIIGDVMLDAYIYGSVTRISPEAPVPVVSVKKRENRIGGAGNVALNVKALGATPVLCSVIGDDAEAAILMSLLQAEGIGNAGIIKSKKRITTVKNRILSASQHLLRIDSEVDSTLSPEDQEHLLSHIFQLMSDVDLIIFEDYDKGCLSKELIAAVIKKATEKGIPTAVDPKKRNFHHYTGCALFKPNLKELKEGLKQELDPTDVNALQKAVIQAQELIHFENAIVTLSDKGIYYQNRTTNGLLPAHIRSIADVSGAGDTVISIAGLCLALGMPLTFIAEFSNLGGGIVCEYQGVLPIPKERLILEATNNCILAEQLG